MKQVIDAFTSVMKSNRRLMEEYDGERRTVKWEIIFLDDSRLIAYESNASVTGRFKYNYHWMTAENDLILRWDNNLHHAHVPTFPHHRHEGTQAEAKPSEPMTLEAVLRFIAAQLSPTSN